MLHFSHTSTTSINYIFMNPQKTYSTAVSTRELGGWKLSVENKVVSAAVRHIVGKLQPFLLSLEGKKGEGGYTFRLYRSQ
jgi:hypothetical protein